MKRLLIDINSIVPYYVTGKVNGIGRTTLELIQAGASSRTAIGYGLCSIIEQL